MTLTFPLKFDCGTSPLLIGRAIKKQERSNLASDFNTMVPVSTVQPSLNEAVGLQIFFHHSDILSCINFYIK